MSLVTAADLAQILGIPADTDGLAQVAGAADATVRGMLTVDEYHDDHAPDREAALAVGVQIWQARQAPGGQMMNTDLGYYASPHLLGSGLYLRVKGLLVGCMPTGGVVAR